MKQKSLHLFSVLALFTLASCNINATPPPDQEEVSTAAALTVQAVLTPLASPVPGSDPSNTPAAQPDTIIAPGELCEENLQIISWKRDGVDYAFDEVNKRLEPNQAFVMEWEFQNTGTCTWDNEYSFRYRDGERIAFADNMPVIPLGNTVAPGQTFKVSIQMAAPGEVGRFESTYSFTNGEGEFITNLGVITVVGNTSSNGSLAAPGELKYLYDCTSGSVVITLEWQDRSDNEDGFRVYREGEKLEDLPANARTYQDIVPSPGKWSYTVSAFNSGGESPANLVANTENCK